MKGQVFTPSKSAEFMLDAVGYNGDVFGKKVLENSCGTGNILIAIVSRYIASGKRMGLSAKDISLGLSRDILGVDLDPGCCETCLLRLDELAQSEGICGVNWRILNIDALRMSFNEEVFDFVIGNPPYIYYRDMDVRTREFLKNGYEVCSEGMFDCYYAFFEQGVNALASGGKLCYLVPNNLFKNVFARKLRTKILPMLTMISDYKTKKLFNALTSSAVIVLEKGSTGDSFLYTDMDEGEECRIYKSSLSEAAKWVLPPINASELDTSITFGDKFHASSSVATLCNRAFLIDAAKAEFDDEYVIITGKGRIEKSIVREAVSPKSKALGQKLLIIYPYLVSEGTHAHYLESDYERLYPQGTLYLKLNKDSLDKRSADKGSSWFEYGRSQGLGTVEKEKLILSTVVSDRLKVYKIDSGAVPFAGIVVVAKEGESLDEAKRILESDKFFRYAKSVGSNVGGASVRITARDVNAFPVYERDFDGKS